MTDFPTTDKALKQRISSYRRYLSKIVILAVFFLLFLSSPALGQDTSGKYVVDSEKSLPFPTPKDTQTNTQNPVNQPHLLKGTLCSWSGSSSSSGSYSSSKWAKFDGIGRFIYGSSSSYSGTPGSMYNNSPDGAGDYEVRGNHIYLRYDDGGCDVAKVYYRQSNGVITEVKFEGTIYAAALCE